MRRWLMDAVTGDEPVGLVDVVLAGFVRVATHPRVFTTPAPAEAAFRFVDVLRAQPAAVPVLPGGRHWEIFRRLCDAAAARGNLAADAYLAAIAIEAGGEWITTDRDFSRFPGLRWRHPLAGPGG
jgi:toxin-antitoxin system PIN domain toxin